MDAQMSFTVSLFDGKTDALPKEARRTWAQLCEKFERPILRAAKDGPLFSPALFRPAHRLQENVTELSLLVLDFDHRASFQADLDAWRALGCCFAAYTTHSHRRVTKSNPQAEERFRVVVPLAVPIPVEKFPALWRWAARISSGKIDAQAQDASRMYYTPAVASPDAPYQFVTVDGETLDWRTLNLDPSLEPQAPGDELLPPTTPTEFASWDELHEEAARRIRQATKAHTDRKGWAHAPGLCHGSADGKAQYVSPDGAYGCLKGCTPAHVRASYGLPERLDTPERNTRTLNALGATARPRSRFTFTTLDDLLSEPEEEVPYVWEKTLPRGGFSICAAKPKVGKSTTARSLAVAVSRGADFFGRPTAKGKVIYLCLEEKRAEIARHFRRMGASGTDIIIYTGRTPDDALTALEDAIEEHSPALIIIDPISRFVRVADFNSYGEVTRGLEPLIDLARASQCQCHIMAVHHNGKGEREGGDALLGSTGFFGAVDTLLTMRRRDQVRTLHTLQRYGEDMPETVAHLDAETGLVTAGGDLAMLQIEERKQAVLEAIGGESLTEPDIKERLGGNQTLTAKAIRGLHEDGTLRRDGGGKRNDPYHYQKCETVAGKSSILDSTNTGNLENRENRESSEFEGEPDWLADSAESDWMRDELDEVRERAAIMEIDGLVPCEEAQRLARESVAVAA